MSDPSQRDEGFGSEESRLSGRVRRYAKVGTSVGGLAAQVVASRLFGVSIDRDTHSAELKAALGGLVLKIGEPLLPVGAQLASHASAHERPAHRWCVGLQLPQLLGIFAR